MVIVNPYGKDRKNVCTFSERKKKIGFTPGCHLPQNIERNKRVIVPHFLTFPRRLLEVDEGTDSDLVSLFRLVIGETQSQHT